MITGLILKALLAVATWVLGLFPSISLPTWFGDVITQVQAGVTPVLALGHWVPLGAIGTTAALILTVFGACLAIRIARIALSVGTGGGGSAA